MEVYDHDFKEMNQKIESKRFNSVLNQRLEQKQ